MVLRETYRAAKKLQFRFFSSCSSGGHNVTALTNHSLLDYPLPSFVELLQYCSDHGVPLSVNDETHATYNMKQHIATRLSPKHLNATPKVILNSPLPSKLTAQYRSHSLESLPSQLPAKLSGHAAIIHDYLTNLISALYNDLSKRFYDPKSGGENITEGEHAKQAAKIAIQLGLPLDDVLAMLFHDISRCTVDSVAHSNQYHSLESHIVITPLGLRLPFAKFHTFAKFLLQSSQKYSNDLLSPFSQQSMGIQKSYLAQHLRELQQQQHLHEFLYTIMLMRLIDDQSKLPMSHLNLPDDEELLPRWLIEGMCVQQMQHHTTRLVEDPDSAEPNCCVFIEQITAAQDLLGRVPSTVDTHRVQLSS